MAPLKARVLVNNSIHIISISVTNPKYGSTRHMNICLSDSEGVSKPIKLGYYLVTTLTDGSYGVTRCLDAGITPVSRCLTLAACQAAVLADYLKWTGIELAYVKEV